MSKKPRFNIEKADSKMFNSIKDINQHVTVLENSIEIEEKARLYESLEYPIKLQKTLDDHGTYWIAEHPDLPGCITHGGSREEALSNLDDAKKGWIYTALSHGMSIPDPGTKSEIEDCSGRILLRVPKELHYKLIQKAREMTLVLTKNCYFLFQPG
ncbi:MAG: hypothetical protein CVV03_12690 [Firmicutes bacterium HGW-Firmicutes-8]|nr:MAG: hypothetical protein CVV03_12690 [Firmicutes bacterium HGW-Firmicutes-8]